MTTVLNELTHRNLFFVADNMRQSDKDEIYATRWTDNPMDVTRDCMASSSAFGWTIGHQHPGKYDPIVALGGFPVWNGVWSVWMFATPRFPEVAIYTTKFIIQKMIPAIYPKAHRVECRSIESHTTAHKWLELMGAKRECMLENYGKGGENFFVYRWRKEDVFP